MLLFSFFLLSTHALANEWEFTERTTLLELRQGSELSDKMSFYSVGGYESSNGSLIRFNNWYTTSWTDARITFLTEITPSFGIIWGISTGESGEKYFISPSFKLGFASHISLSPVSSLSLKATTIIGGNLHETPCSADYGEIGGIQTVNCRLAATGLEPSATLAYLFNEAPFNQNVVLIEYKLLF